MRKLAIALGLALPALLPAGCANQQGAQSPFGAGLTAPSWPDMRAWTPAWPVQMTSAQAPGLVEEVGPARALAYLPPQAGQPVSVGERRGAESLDQDIVLGGAASYAGQNRITVRMRWGDTQEARDAMRRPTEYSIAREIDEAFPNGSVQPTSAIVANADGPIGVAAGRSGGANCVFAWQSLRTTRTGGWFEQGASIGTQVRVRLCDASLSQQQLIQLVAGLSVAHAPQSRLASLIPFNQTPAYVNSAPASYDPMTAMTVAPAYAAPGYAAPAYGGSGYAAPAFAGSQAAAPYAGMAPAGTYPQAISGCGGAFADAGVCPGVPAAMAPSAYSLAAPAALPPTQPRMVWAATPLPPARPAIARRPPERAPVERVSVKRANIERASAERRLADRVATRPAAIRTASVERVQPARAVPLPTPAASAQPRLPATPDTPTTAFPQIPLPH